MRKLRIALIGYGYWGKKLFKTLRLLRSIQVVAVCDKNLRVLNESRLLDSGAQLSQKYENILSSPDINAVVIATPPETHYPIAMASLQKEKHVLLEKPMTLEKTQAQMLNKLVQKKKLILMIDHTYLYAPEIRVAKQIIESGALGNIRFVEATRVGPGQYKHDTDVIWDFAPHDISILLYLLGMPKELFAVHACHLHRHRIDASNLYFKFTHGCNAKVYLSWLSPTKIRKMFIVGAKKSLLVEKRGITSKIRVYSNACYFRDKVQTNTHSQVLKNLHQLSGLPYAEPLRNVCQEFVRCIINNTQPLSDGRIGYEIVNIIQAIYQVPSLSNKAILF